MYSTSLWHPCSQMKDYESFTPLNIKYAKGSCLYSDNNTPIIDAISSWWCKSLGHNHPAIKAAILKQLEVMEHTILANTTNTTVDKLGQRLCHLTGLDKVLFASDGSCAVEIAMKMASHARHLRNQAYKKKFIALKNGYHGETCATLSISDLGLYKDAYQDLLFDCEHIPLMPYVTGRADPLWHDASEHWQKTKKFLDARQKSLNAIILEPILQGAGGMRIYSQDFLKRLGNWCKENDVYLIADEIMTGIGRCGKMLASEHARIDPDFVCLSKGLTGGVLPLSVTLTHNTLYALFYDDYESQKAFLHSHTHSGNTLASAVALAVLDVFEQENLLDYINQSLAPKLLNNMIEVAEKTGKLHNIRAIGAVVAADLKNPAHSRAGYQIYQKAVKLGALLRPLGNTLYWLPPLNSDSQTLDQLKTITIKALKD